MWRYSCDSTRVCSASSRAGILRPSRGLGARAPQSAAAARRLAGDGTGRPTCLRPTTAWVRRAVVGIPGHVLPAQKVRGVRGSGVHMQCVGQRRSVDVSPLGGRLLSAFVRLVPYRSAVLKRPLDPSIVGAGRHISHAGAGCTVPVGSA